MTRFFCLNYDFSYTGVSNTSISSFQDALINEILIDYKHLEAPSSGIGLWEFAMRTVVCGTNLSGNCALPSISSLPVNDQDQIWNTYKQLYIAEKKKIAQLFINFKTIAEDCYNGYIEDPIQSHALIQSYSDYPVFVTGDPTTGNLSSSNYNGSNGGLLDFLDDALTATGVVLINFLGLVR